MRLPESVLLGGPWASVALVQVTLMALVSWLAWLLARRGGPALRAAILLAALVGLLLAPAVAPVAPVWLSLPEWVCPTGAGPPADSPDGGAPPPGPTAPTVFTLVVGQPPAQEMADPEEPRSRPARSPCRCRPRRSSSTWPPRRRTRCPRHAPAPSSPLPGTWRVCWGPCGSPARSPP